MKPIVVGREKDYKTHLGVWGLWMAHPTFMFCFLSRVPLNLFLFNLYFLFLSYGFIFYLSDLAVGGSFDF